MKRYVLNLSVAALLLFSAGCDQPETALEGEAGSEAADAARTQLTSGPANDFNIQFSPDGGQIAFISDQEGELKVWTVPDVWPRWSVQKQLQDPEIGLAQNALSQSQPKPFWWGNGQEPLNRPSAQRRRFNPW